MLVCQSFVSDTTAQVRTYRPSYPYYVNESQIHDYWEQRLRDGPTLANTGWLGWGAGFNQWMYRVRARSFVKRVRAALSRFGIDIDRTKVLDIGSGTGFYIDLWRRVGASDIMCCDLTEAAVRALRERYPAAPCTQVDIGATALPYPAQTFGAISCMDVLFHIVDDGRYRQAIQNCAALLKPGGILIMTENCLHGNTVRSANQVSRSLTQIEDTISGSGLTIVERRPVFVLMNAPIDSGYAALKRFWSLLRACAGRRPSTGFIAGALLYPFEVALTSVMREGPSTEMLICRRSQ